MEPERLEYFRTLLQERLEEILGEADKTRNDMTGVTAPFPDPTDRATLETDRNFTLRIRDRERKLISKIREALDRIDAGTYGYCDLCGGEISRKAPQSPAGDHHVHRLQIQGRRPWSGPGASNRLPGANPSWSSADRVRCAALNRKKRQHHLPAAPFLP